MRLKAWTLPALVRVAGSIGWLDRPGVLRVGPQSGGADSGPACYGKGGQEPTVTDADALLGHTPTDYFLGGTIRLDKNLAENAVYERVAKPSFMKHMESITPLGRIGEPEEITGAVLYLASGASSYVSGTTILVNGGGLV